MSKIKKTTIIGPSTGWKADTYYLVDAAFNKHNPVHRSIFYSGFLRDGKPDGYNTVFNATYDGYHNNEIDGLYYIRVIKELYCDDVHEFNDADSEIKKWQKQEAKQAKRS